MLRRVAFASVVLLLGSLVLAVPAFATAPTVTSFSPTSGGIGDTVTFTGTSFAAPATVTFGSATASGTVVSATRLTVQVPAGAATAKPSVTTPGGTATASTTFTVTPGSSLTPASGPTTTVTTFAYAGFGAHEAVDIYLDTTDVQLSSANSVGDGSVSLTIAASATPGTHWITAVGRHTGDSAQSSFLVRENWPQEGDDALHRGRNSYENVLNPSSVGGLGELYRSGPGASDGFPPRGTVVVKGVVYVAFQVAGLTAYTEASGAQRWNRPISPANDFLTTPPAVSGATVYVGTVTQLLALNTSTGAVRWHYLVTGAGVTGAPTVAGNVVYFTDTHDVVHALNATTGAQLWSFDPGDSATAQPFGSPAVYGSNVYVALDGSVFALSVSNGAIVWQNPVGANPTGSVAVADGQVYAPYGTVLYAMKTTSGSGNWSYTDPATLGSPAFASGTVYLATSGNQMLARSAGTGTAEWTATVPNAYAQGERPSIADGVVYVGESNATVALAASYGGQLWSSGDNTAFGSPPVLDGALFASDRGQFVRYDLNGDTSPATARPNPAKLRRTAAV